MNMKLLKLLNKDARYSVEDLAVMLGLSEEEVASEIDQMEKEGIICGYKPLIDWEKVDEAFISAVIEIKVIPKAGLGFEEVAKRVMKYPAVETVYLMSGGFDLTVIIKDRTMREVARFVAEQLAPMENVLSTGTHFILKKYKDYGVEYNPSEKDKREVMMSW